MTYAVGRPEPHERQTPPMIGVLKRCLRLVTTLSEQSVERHLLHFGPLPEDDPLVRAIVPEVRVHRLTSDDPRAECIELCRDVAPDVVVLGEGPGGGMMTLVSKVARDLGIPQVCIENYYSSAQPAKFARDTPWVVHWVLLGLPLGRAYGRISHAATLLPPLLPPPARRCPWTTMTILGYDPAAAELGLRLFEALPRGATARLVGSGAPARRLPAGVQVVDTPTDAELHAYLRRSAVVVCKSGFQQVVEALAAGTPVVAREAVGGVGARLLCREMQPFVCYARGAFESARCLPAALSWTQARPSMPWLPDVERFPNARAFVAACFVQILRKVSERRTGPPDAARAERGRPTPARA